MPHGAYVLLHPFTHQLDARDDLIKHTRAAQAAARLDAQLPDGRLPRDIHELYE